MNELVKAINNKDAKRIYILIEKGADINTTNHNNECALFVAAKQNLFDLAKYLIEKGADLEISTRKPVDNSFMTMFQNDYNIVNSDTETPLWWASKKGHYEIVDLLLKHGAIFNTVKGTSPLIEACRYGYLSIVHLLVKYGADINYVCFYKKDFDYTTVLKEAVRYKYKNIVKFLLKNNVDIYNSKCEISTLEIAVSRKYTTIFKVILEEIKERDIFKTYNKLLSKCLTIASRTGAFIIVEMLLKEDIDLDYQNINKSTSLMEACNNGYIRIVSLLLKHNVNVEKINLYGETAMDIVIKNGYHKILTILNNSDKTTHKDLRYKDKKIEIEKST
jgi:ankyrin repeat protein